MLCGTILVGQPWFPILAPEPRPSRFSASNWQIWGAPVQDPTPNAGYVGEFCGQISPNIAAMGQWLCGTNMMRSFSLKKWVHHRAKRNLGGLARSSATLIPLSHFLSSNLAARELSGKQGMPLIHSLTHLYWVSRCFHCIPQSFAVALICPSCTWQPCTGEIRWTVSGAPRGTASTTTGYIP